MKVYYFLNSVSETHYNYLIEKLELLKQWYDIYYLINKYFYKVSEDNTWRINYAFFIEILTLIEELKQKYNYDYSEVISKIEFIRSNKNFFIFNERIYIENDSEYEEIDLTKKTYFVTSRDTWLNSFFHILYKLSEIKKNVIILRANKRKWSVYNDDKVYNISKLYKNRKKLVWNFIAPFLSKRKEDDLIKFFDFIKLKLWRYIVIKKSGSQCWDGVKMLDLDNYKDVETFKFVKNNYFLFDNNFVFTVYLTPYYKIQKEYRLYFTYNKNNDKSIEIFLMKNRVNEDIWNVFWPKNYTINKDTKVTWNYTKYDDFINEKRIIKFVKKIIKWLKFDKWVIEIIENQDNELIFSEINTAWWVLMFRWDEDKTIEYNKKIWNNLL